MAVYYGRIPLSVRIDLNGDITDEMEEKMENDEELFEVFADNILSLTEDGTVSYEVEYDGDGSFSFSSTVEMYFDAGYIPGYWDDYSGGCPPESWCDMDESTYSDKKIAAGILRSLPDYLKGMKVSVDSTFSDRDVDLNPEPAGAW